MSQEGQTTRRRTHRRVAGVARVLSFYLGAVWVYVAVIGVVQAGTLPQPISHLIHVRRDTTGVVCLAASVVLYVVAQWIDPKP